MPTSFSPVEILVVLVVALIVLGPNRLPQAGKQVGRALAEMKRWSRGIQNEIRDVIDTEFEPPTTASTPSTPASPPEVAETSSGPTEREAQGPSGPTEREAQGPSGPTERETPAPPAPTNGSAIAGDEPPRN